MTNPRVQTQQTLLLELLTWQLRLPISHLVSRPDPRNGPTRF